MKFIFTIIIFTFCLNNLFSQTILLENFDSTSVPIGWNNSASTGPGWSFSTNSGYDTSSVLDHTSNGGNYAWVDFSGTDLGVVLEMPNTDVSSLTAPYLEFFHASYYNGTVLTVFNYLYIEAWNGTSYDIIATLQGNNPSSEWVKRSYNLTSYIYNTNMVKIRFRGESGGDGNDFYNDILIDDVRITNQSTLSTNDIAFIKNDYTLFPNPSSEFIQLTGLTVKENYKIYNILGSEIKNGTISNNEQINIRNFTNGLYFLKFDNGNSIKFIKQ